MLDGCLMLALLVICHPASLPDTEVGEDVVEDVFGVDFACDGAEVVEGLAEGGGTEVGGEAAGEAGAHGAQGVGGGGECLVVSEVGDDEGGGRGVSGRSDFDEAVAQGGQAPAGTSGQVEDRGRGGVGRGR